MMRWPACKPVYYDGHIEKPRAFKFRMYEKTCSRCQGLLKHAMCPPKRLLHLISL